MSSRGCEGSRPGKCHPERSEGSRPNPLHPERSEGSPSETEILLLSVAKDLPQDEATTKSLVVPPRDDIDARYSHSIVPGGLEVMSKTTRVTAGTSLTMRLDKRASRS